MNGACPLAIDESAASSKTVDVKFCPLPPTFENNATEVPIRCDQHGAEVRVIGISDIKTDRDVGNRECARCNQERSDGLAHAFPDVAVVALGIA